MKYAAQEIPLRDAWIGAHIQAFTPLEMGVVLDVSISGYRAWKQLQCPTQLGHGGCSPGTFEQRFNGMRACILPAHLFTSISIRAGIALPLRDHCKVQKYSSPLTTAIMVVSLCLALAAAFSRRRRRCRICPCVRAPCPSRARRTSRGLQRRAPAGRSPRQANGRGREAVHRRPRA